MMPLETVQNMTTWEPVQTSSNALTLASPFNFGEDGARITFTVLFPTEDSFFLTDFAEHIMLADSFGIKFGRGKVNQLNQTHGVKFAQFNEDGEIWAAGKNEDLQFALFDAAKLALSLSFRYQRWLPKFNTIRFKAMVGKVLRNYLQADKVKTDWAITGASGHTIKFPFAVEAKDGSHTLISTIALNDEKIDWATIYQTHGRLYDVKNIDDLDRRVVIMEYPANNQEFDRAASFLADVASIRTLEASHKWAKSLAV